MQRLITSLRLIDTKHDNSIYLLYVGGLSLIINDQENSSNAKLTARYWLLNIGVLFHNSF